MSTLTPSIDLSACLPYHSDRTRKDEEVMMTHGDQSHSLSVSQSRGAKERLALSWEDKGVTSLQRDDVGLAG